jgi:hypothetical protein
MGTTIEREMFSALTTEELRTLGGMLGDGGLEAGTSPLRYRDYDLANEALNISAEVYHMARHREEAQAALDELEAEA